jgi:hypothetical protein
MSDAEDFAGGDPPLLAVLLQNLNDIAAQGEFPASVVDRSKARILLEAVGGDVELAAQLYWDDFLASQEQHNERDNERDNHDEDLPPAAQRHEHHQLHDDDAPDDDMPDNHDNNHRVPPVMELLHEDEEDVARRLEGDFERAHRRLHNQRAAAQNVAEDARVARMIAQAQETVQRLAQDEVVVEGQDGNIRAMAQRAAQAFLAAAAQQETVSISDDEGDAFKRSAAHRDGHNSHRNPVKRSVSELASGQRKKRKGDCEDDGNNTNETRTKILDIDTDGYLSDSDWVWETLATRTHIPLSQPMDLLWGLPPDKTPIAAPLDQEDNDVDDLSANSDDANNNNNNNNNGSNVIADDEGDEPSSNNNIINNDRNNVNNEINDGSNDNNNNNPTNQSSEHASITGIPKTWLNAGFQLDEEANGLTIQPPCEDDVAYYAWQGQVQQNTGHRAAVAPPYHCRAMTAITSIVTALLYSGTCVQQNQASCKGAWRKPFAELSKEDRRREFDARLADALASLLVVAANASMKRKTIALAKLKEADIGKKKKHEEVCDNKKLKWHKLEYKLQLCPTCTWDQEPEIRLLEGRATDHNLHLATSYTNIDDMRSFVSAQLDHFTSSGGIALFLETLLRIHGKGAVNRMISHARGLNHLTSNTKCLINCTCEDIYWNKLEESVTTAKIRENFPNKLDTSPQCHSCLSVELLSLLLTGTVHSSLEGWSSRELGIGLLTYGSERVSKGLTRPEKPVWILRGPTCYTTIWLNSSHKDTELLNSRIDQPGSVARMIHWNSWFGERQKTDFRMILKREWTAHEVSSVSDGEGVPTTCKTVSLITKRNIEHTRISKQLMGTEPLGDVFLCSQGTLDRIVAHPDDQQFYPTKYQSWRFDMGEDDDSEDQRERKPRGVVWKPFHRLSEFQKTLVDVKLGPKLTSIIWTRWPGATVDLFEPNDPAPIV